MINELYYSSHKYHDPGVDFIPEMLIDVIYYYVVRYKEQIFYFENLDKSC